MFADAIKGDCANLDLFEDAKHLKVPMADIIGSPMLALGMSYFRLRDKLGL